MQITPPRFGGRWINRPWTPYSMKYHLEWKMNIGRQNPAQSNFVSLTANSLMAISATANILTPTTDRAPCFGQRTTWTIFTDESLPNFDFRLARLNMLLFIIIPLNVRWVMAQKDPPIWLPHIGREARMQQFADATRQADHNHGFCQ